MAPGRSSMLRQRLWASSSERRSPWLLFFWTRLEGVNIEFVDPLVPRRASHDPTEYRPRTAQRGGK